MAADPPALTWEQIISDNNAPPPPMPPLDTGVYPYGINGFSWELGGDEWMGDPSRVPSSQYSAMTGWFIIYQEANGLHGNAKPTVACKVSMRKQKAFVHFKNGGWSQVQDDKQLDVAQMDPHQTKNTGNPAVTWNAADSTWNWNSPPANSINHGWPHARGGFASGSVDGVWWSFEMKVDKDGANLIVASGVDWWGTTSGGSNTGYSQSNWRRLNTDWLLVTGTSMSREALLRDPPPPLQGMGTTPPIVNPPIEPPVTTGGNIEISVDGKVLASGSQVSFKVK